MEPIVNIYIMTNCKGIKTSIGHAVTVLEFVTASGQKATKLMHHERGASTDNAMVLYELEQALLMLNKACHVTIYTDNTYVSGHIATGHLQSWKDNGWCNARGVEIANKRTWQNIYFLMQVHSIRVSDEKEYEYRSMMSEELEKYV